MKRLIQLRKNHPAFRMPNADLIRAHLKFEEAPPQSVAYTLRNHANGDEAKDLYVIHNANWHPIEVHVPKFGVWRELFGEVLNENRGVILHGTVKVAPYDTVVLFNPAD